MLLETARLILRDWRASDKEAFALINADPEVMEFFPKCLTEDESANLLERIEKRFKKKGWGLFAVELKKNGELLGFVGLQEVSFLAHFTPCIEIGWRLKRSAWGYGYAFEAAQEVLRFAREKLELEKIYAFTSKLNTKSLRLMERLGMQRVPGGDFKHPMLPKGDRLEAHTLYCLSLENPTT